MVDRHASTAAFHEFTVLCVHSQPPTIVLVAVSIAPKIVTAATERNKAPVRFFILFYN